jgi:hypothetical protein
MIVEEEVILDDCDNCGVWSLIQAFGPQNKQYCSPKCLTKACPAQTIKDRFSVLEPKFLSYGD